MVSAAGARDDLSSATSRSSFAPTRRLSVQPGPGGDNCNHRTFGGAASRLTSARLTSGRVFESPPSGRKSSAPSGGLGLHGHRMNVEAAHGSVPAVLYSPSSRTKVVGMILLTPGSGGGLGPGLTVHPQPFEAIRNSSAHGAIYTRMGIELSTGRERKKLERICSLELMDPTPLKGTTISVNYDSLLFLETSLRLEVNWQYRPTGNTLPPLMSSSGAHLNGIVVMQIDWTQIPRTKLRRLDMLQSSMADTAAACMWLAEKYPGVPLILGGFSFGGPTVWAVAAQLHSQAPGLVKGLVSIAGSARGGERFDSRGMGTVASVRTCAGTFPCLFVHGTHDKNVALQVAEHLYKEASKPKELAVVPLSPHMFDNCREATYQVIRRWLLSAFFGDTHAADVGKPCESKVTYVGKQMKLRPGETKGQEKWRCAVSHNRLSKYCSENEDGNMHKLAGLVGYSE